MATYGLYDTKDHCWLGNQDGPQTYDSQDKAILAARIIDVKFGRPAGQTRAKCYGGDANTKKDDINSVMSAERAIDLLERGAVL